MPPMSSPITLQEKEENSEMACLVCLSKQYLCYIVCYVTVKQEALPRHKEFWHPEL